MDKFKAFIWKQGLRDSRGSGRDCLRGPFRQGVGCKPPGAGFVVALWGSPLALGNGQVGRGQ